MLRMFGRRKPKTTVAAASDADAWTIFEGAHDGHPMFARFNTGFGDATDRAEYGIQVGVAIPLNEPDPQGLPQPPELSQLDAIEEEVVAEAAGRAVFVGVITTRSMREFVLYTSKGDWIEPFHHALEAAVTSHEVQVMAQHDPRWKTYRRFVK